MMPSSRRSLVADLALVVGVAVALAACVALAGCAACPAPCAQPVPPLPGTPWPTTTTVPWGAPCEPSVQVYRLPVGDEVGALSWPTGYVAVRSSPGLTRRGYGHTPDEALRHAGADD